MVGVASDFGDAVAVAVVPLAEPDMDMVVEGEVLELAKPFWPVIVAVKPVTLLQADPTEEFVPVTKLTAAHYENKQQRLA